MKTTDEILGALEKLSRMKFEPEQSESPGEFYARLHYVDGIRRAAMELANWIAGDEVDEMAESLRQLEQAPESKLKSNGRAINLQVQIEPDLIDEIHARRLRLSDAVNNALALYCLKQMRMSNRSLRNPQAHLSPNKSGRICAHISVDEDLVESLYQRVGAQGSKNSVLNGALRLYLWSLDVLTSDTEVPITPMAE